MFDLQGLAQRVQALRAERGLTLQQLAASSSVSVSMLSSVERAEKAPTIVVLARIADGLGVSLGRLVAEPVQDQIIVRRAGDQDVGEYAGGWRRMILSPVVPGVNFELIRTTLPVGCDAGVFPGYAAGSHEYVAVEAGQLQVTIGESVILLHQHDSVYFAADVTHGYANPSGMPCTYYVAALIMRSRR